VLECVEAKMKWLGRRLRHTDENSELGQWVDSITLLTDYYWKLKIGRRSAGTANFEVITNPTIHILGLEDLEKTGLKGLEMDIEEDQKDPPVKETDKVPPQVDVRTNMTNEDELAPALKQLEGLRLKWVEVLKELDEIQQNLDEEEKIWWDALRRKFEEDEDVGSLPANNDKLQEYFKKLMVRVEGALGKSFKDFPRKKRHTLWSTLYRATRLLFAEWIIRKK